MRNKLAVREHFVTVRSSAKLALAGVITLAALTGCATPPPASDKEAMAAFKEDNDPLEHLRTEKHQHT